MFSKKFNPFKDFQSDQLQRSSRKIFTAHYASRNSDLNLTQTTNGVIFQIINSLIESWGLRLTWFDCKYVSRVNFDSTYRKIKVENTILRFLPLKYCWFSHDVTKIQTKKLSILPSFYFYDALEQLKTNFHTNFRFKRVLGFVIEYTWTSKLLRDAAFTWRPRELSYKLKKDLFQEILLSKQFMY